MRSVPACAPATGSGTQHGVRITQAETWAAADSPHVIPNDLDISATVTIEACAVVMLAPAVTVTVRTGGSIVAQGTADAPVAFEPRDAGQPWTQLRTIGGTLSFTHTQLLGGGAPGNTLVDVAAALDIRADAAAPPAEILHADHLEIRDSASQGIYMVANGEFSADSTDVVIAGAQHYPIRATANVAGSIPSGTYTGNAIDEIDLEGDGMATVDHDVVLHDRGVPYHVGDPQHPGNIAVAARQAGQVAHLTIEPNVTLRFEPGGGLFVQVAQTSTAATGALIAVGTATAPIVFTSAAATPAPGDWLGIYFNGLPDPASALDHVTIDDAGGVSTLEGSSCLYPGTPPPLNPAAIRVFVEPASAFIHDTTIAHSAGHGFDRGWRGDASMHRRADPRARPRACRERRNATRSEQTWRARVHPHRAGRARSSSRRAGGGGRARAGCPRRSARRCVRSRARCPARAVPRVGHDRATYRAVQAR